MQQNAINYSSRVTIERVRTEWRAVKNAEKLMSSNWNKVASLKKILDCGDDVRSVDFYIRIRKTDPDTGADVVFDHGVKTRTGGFLADLVGSAIKGVMQEALARAIVSPRFGVFQDLNPGTWEIRAIKC